MTNQPKTLKCPVYLNAGQSPNRVALRDGRFSLTYRELESRITEYAGRLLRLGVKEDDRVAIISLNSIDYAALIFTLYRIGASAVPINLRQTPDRWKRCIEETNCRLVLIDRGRHDAAKELGFPTIVIDKNGWHGFSDPDGEVLSQEVPHVVPADSETTVIFSSGSTGSPRGVVLTFGNHYHNALGSNSNIPLMEDDCWLAVLPFYHVGGLAILFRSALAGSSVYVMDRFNARRIGRLIDEKMVTHISLVPTMLERLIEERKLRPFPGSLRAVLLGGAPVPEKLARMIIDRSIPALTTYGMTETASQIATLSPGDPPEKLRSSGRPLSQCEVKIIDAAGRPVVKGSPGEIAVRGEIVFKGYLGEEATDTFDSHGWFWTGDVGFFDDEGYLFVVGRKDAMFVSGGENINPREIENAAMGFPGVTESSVIAVEDERWGHRPVLFVSIRIKPLPGAGARRAVPLLQAFLREHLPPIMVPDEIVVIDEFPRTTIGKIDKVKLREIYRETDDSPL